jgi:hypothetical protein
MHMTRLALAAALVLALAPSGQATIHTFTVASIDGVQETPANGSVSTGMGTFTLDDSTGVASFNITHNCCASGEIAAHVHGPAAPGVPAGILYFLPPGSPKVGNSPALSPAQQADMLNNLHYVNIHSNAFPNGEIRGQIINDNPPPTTSTTTSTTLPPNVQLKPSKVLLVKNPPAGAFKRKVVWKVKEQASSNTVTGNPIASGAKLRVSLTPGGDQCFDLPAANWSAISSIGFKYKDPDLSEGPVKVASIKKTPAGVFLIKAVISGKGPSQITVTPGNPTATYATNLKMGGGDEYCSGTGTATPNPNDAKTFKVVNDTTPGSCTVSACSPSGAFLD